MTLIQIEIPEPLSEIIEKLAERSNVSVEHFLTLLVTQKISSLDVSDQLAENVRQIGRNLLAEVLASVPDVEPEEWDRL